MNEPKHIVCPHCDAINRVPAGKLADAPICGRCRHLLFTATPVALNQENFLHHLTHSDIPVLVDFWAPWCGPCRMMAPAFEHATQRLEPQMRTAKLNTEEAPQLAMQYNIRSIPTLALFRNGREIARQTGAMDAASIVAWAESKAA